MHCTDISFAAYCTSMVIVECKKLFLLLDKNVSHAISLSAQYYYNIQCSIQWKRVSGELTVRIWGICSHVPWLFCVCLSSCSGGVCCFQFRLSCVHVVWSYVQSQCCVVTIRLFPGLAGFPSPPSFTPRLLIPALCSFA